mgnify:CR=1 FL=1|tara:strand:- start:1386 stop:1688 length:303 start_codon:yes stop_codon:yes gene_type:complete
MPFVCNAEILPDQLRESTLFFDAWLDDVWESYVPAGTAFAIAHDSRGSCELCLAGPGFLSTRPKLQPGDEIRIGTIVAYFSADGEDIPYGRPYCDLLYGD